LVRRPDRRLPPALSRRPPRGPRRACASAAARSDGGAARLRRPARAPPASGMEPLRRRGPAAPRPRDLARLARGRPLPRREHPRLRRALAAAEVAERLPRGRVRRCGRAPAEPWRLRRRLGPAAATVTEARPAFYALAPGGWRDYLTLLHPPYTAWHLSYVAIGATLAPHFHADRLGAAAAAFFLGLGVGARA